MFSKFSIVKLFMFLLYLELFNFYLFFLVFLISEDYLGLYLLFGFIFIFIFVGKFIVGYLFVCGEKEYYLVCVCEELYVSLSVYFWLYGLIV